MFQPPHRRKTTLANHTFYIPYAWPGGGGAGARPRTAAAEAVAKKKREMKESQEEAAMELLAHFNHR